MSEAQQLVKILWGNRITLPRDFVERRQLKVGESLKYEEDGAALKLTPVQITVQAKIA